MQEGRVNVNLRRITYGSGPGFCYEAVPQLITYPGTHGPLLVALDSNIVLNLQAHLEEIVSAQPVQEVDPWLSSQLVALGQVVNTWFTRDIRFLILPKAFSDAKKRPLTHEARLRIQRKLISLDRVRASLVFQTDDWDGSEVHYTSRGDSQLSLDLNIPSLDALPKGADKELIEEAILNGVDVFLTCDKRLIQAGRRISTPYLKILSPLDLTDLFDSIGITPFSGGIIEHDECPYQAGMLAGDTGKWVALLSVQDPEWRGRY